MDLTQFLEIGTTCFMFGFVGDRTVLVFYLVYEQKVLSDKFSMRVYPLASFLGS